MWLYPCAQRAGEGGNPAAAAAVPPSEHFGDEPEGLRSLSRFERPGNPGKLGGNAESFVPDRGGGLFLFRIRTDIKEEIIMLDINLLRTNPDLVRENIKKKFQDAKLPLVDEVIELDKANRAAIQRADFLRSQRNKISKSIGGMMAKGQREEAEAAKQQVKDMQDELAELEQKEAEYAAQIRERMLVIPQIIDDSVPIGKDLSLIHI